VFKVREFTVQDWNGYPINLKWNASIVPPTKTGDAPDTEMQVFSLGNAIPSVKALTFHRALPEAELAAAANGAVDFTIDAVYDESAISERGLPNKAHSSMASFIVKGIKKLAGDPNAAGDGVAKATFKIKARLDGNNMIS
jgi:hypothetical protein